MPRHSNIQEEIEKNNIQIIILKEFYEATRVNRTKSGVWTRKDIMKLKENQLKVLSAFIDLNEEILSIDKISNHTKLVGKPLGPVLASLKKDTDWLVRKHPSGGWQFNKIHRQEVIDTLKKFSV